MKNGRSGFTLIEILLVLVIISLMAGIGVVGYSGTYKRMRVEKAAKQLALMVKYARILAVERQGTYLIKLDNENKGFFIFEQGSEEPLRDTYSKPVKLDAEVVFEQIKIVLLGTELSDEDAADCIRFHADGTAQTAVVQLGDGISHMTVGVDAATARAKVYDGQAEDVKTRTVDLDDLWN